MVGHPPEEWGPLQACTLQNYLTRPANLFNKDRAVNNTKCKRKVESSSSDSPGCAPSGCRRRKTLQKPGPLSGPLVQSGLEERRVQLRQPDSALVPRAEEYHAEDVQPKPLLFR